MGITMNWNDIPKMTRQGSYQVDQPFHRLEKFFSELENSYGLQLNPDFQRGHVWNEQQQIAFVEFFLKGGRTGNIVFLNQPSWQNSGGLIDGYDDFVCVDGLQRITALRRFNRNEIPAFGTLFKDFQGIIPWSDFNLKVNVNNLKTKEDVLTWYLEMNSGGIAHTKEELDKVKKMLKNA